MIATLGIFGGSFNPPHAGHAALAQLALEELRLDRLIWVPSGSHPFEKESLKVPFSHRAGMVDALCAGQNKFEMWSGEGRMEGKTYSLRTIRELQQIYRPDTTLFILGSDNIPSFHTWYRFEELLAAADLAVVSRPGSETAQNHHIPADKIHTIESPHWGVSSSLLRNYMKQGFSCRYLIPDPVRRYINENNLYQETT
ncbi:MAG: nicotinate (nicotinamide) nucleotide adenylyltransferase [Fibrobacterota bacterium]